MKLEFNSIDELAEFIDFAYQIGSRMPARDAPPQGVSGSAGGVAGDRLAAAGSTYTAGDGSPADQEARDMQMGPYDPALVPPMGDGKTPPPEEPAKRKRRTKAEIEADAKAAELTKTQEGQNAGEAALESARAVLRDKEQPPVGPNPFEQRAAEPASAPEGHVDGAAEATDTAVTPFQHLTRAREFIAKHGMPKYNESFAKAGLDPNVMGYTAEQRALHMDALSALEAA